MLYYSTLFNIISILSFLSLVLHLVQHYNGHQNKLVSLSLSSPIPSPPSLSAFGFALISRDKIVNDGKFVHFIQKH